MVLRTVYTILLTLVVLAGCQRTPAKVSQNIESPDFDLQADAGHPLQEFEEKNDDPIAAAADRYQRRLSADGTVPAGALMRAKVQRDALQLNAVPAQAVPGNRGGAKTRSKIRDIHSAGSSRSAGVAESWPVTWEWVGPGNIGGRLRPIVIHPTNNAIMYVGSASGGIWKTTDAGQSWAPLDDFLPSLSVGDMVMHPIDSDTLYAGTGEGFFETTEGSSNTAAVRGAGIFLSTDAGTTWTQLPSTDNPDFYFVNRLEFDPLDPTIIFAATNTGIWRSADDGLTWDLQEPFHALDIKFNPNNPMQAVAGGHDTEDGPYYSSDGGFSWQLATGAGGERQEIAWAPGETNTVYSAVSNGGRIKIWKSTDGGLNYSLQTTGNGIQTWAGYNNTIWIDPANSDFMILGGVFLYNSVNGGASFTRRFNAVHADMHRIVPHPGFDGTNNKTVFFATDGGIWQTDDVFANSAFDLNNNLGVTQFYGGGINPSTGHIIGGTQDNGTLFYSGDPQDWDHIFGGDGGYGAADPTDPDYFYGEVQRAFLHRTSNGGGNSSYIYNGPNPIQDAGSASTTNFIPFFMLDPNESNRMLVACERMWRSNNVKASQPDWFSIKDSIAPPGVASDNRGDDPPEAHFAQNSPYNISTIGVASGNPDVIWAAHNNGNLYFTANGTASAPAWTRVDENGTGLPDRWISTVVVDHNDHNHVYVAFMGWHSDNLWETFDSGTTWTDISGNGTTSIPDAPISALALHRNLGGWLFVGTDIGLFRSTDNGATWTTEPGDGPGTIPIEQLLWKNDSTLLAVTHGRGMYLAVENSTVPNGSKLLDGVQTGGQLSDVFSSDGIYLDVTPSPTTNFFKQRIDFIVQGELGNGPPTGLQFRLKSKMLGGPAGDVVQTISLWNETTSQFELVDTRVAAIADETVLTVPNGNVTDYVHPLTNEVTARIKWQSPSFSGTPFWWSVEIDETIWLSSDSS